MGQEKLDQSFLQATQNEERLDSVAENLFSSKVRASKAKAPRKPRANARKRAKSRANSRASSPAIKGKFNGRKARGNNLADVDDDLFGPIKHSRIRKRKPAPKKDDLFDF